MSAVFYTFYLSYLPSFGYSGRHRHVKARARKGEEEKERKRCTVFARFARHASNTLSTGPWVPGLYLGFYKTHEHERTLISGMLGFVRLLVNEGIAIFFLLFRFLFLVSYTGATLKVSRLINVV